MIKFNHCKNFILPKIKQININGTRHYVTPNGTYPSVTSVTEIISKDAILEWRKRLGEALANYQMILAATAGTATHKICREYLSNENIKKHKKLIPLAHFKNLKPKLKKINNIYGLECRVYSNNYRVAGTIDCVAEYDGILSIIDFKTTKQQKKEDWILQHFCQTTMYREAWYELTKQKINQIVIIISGLDGSITEYKKNPDDYLEKITELRNTYETQNNNLENEIMVKLKDNGKLNSADIMPKIQCNPVTQFNKYKRDPFLNLKNTFKMI